MPSVSPPCISYDKINYLVITGLPTTTDWCDYELRVSRPISLSTVKYPTALRGLYRFLACLGAGRDPDEAMMFCEVRMD